MMPTPWLWLSLLFTVCFSLATQLNLWFQDWTGNRIQTDDMLSVLLGDSRRMFANHFFVKADVYFHGGYYPTIFDQATPPKQLHVAERGATSAQADHQEDNDMPDFLGEPQDWIDRFGRNFYPTKHQHLEKGGEEKELLPWLLLSAELDPHRAQTYTVAAYWLRTRLGKVKEAEQFLRAGLRANPDSVEILVELGRLYDENLHDTDRARNVWEAALRKWQATVHGNSQADPLLYREILAHLARLEERTGHLAEAIGYFKLIQRESGRPQIIQQQIDELQKRLGSQK